MKHSMYFYTPNKVIVYLLILLFIQCIYTFPSIKQQQLPPFSIPLKQYLNNKAFGAGGDVDHIGTAFTTKKTTELPGNYTYSEFDNVEISNTGKVISLGKVASLGALYVLASVSHGPLTIDASVIYDDNTQDTTTLSIPDWQDEHVNEMQRYKVIQYPLSNGRQGALFQIPIYTNPLKTPTELQFSSPNNSKASLHLFTVTAYPVKGVIVSDVKVTNEWRNKKDQVLLVELHNTGTSWVRNATIHVTSDFVKTVKHGLAELIAPGHVHCVQVVIQSSGHKQQKEEYVTISVSGVKLQYQIKLDSELSVYEATSKSVQRHRSPTWLRKSKFGIFIHWGLYSVPGWAPVGKSYAEWYWWNMHNDEPTFKYHRQTYGEDFAYDQFLNLWKPTEFNPSAWLSLIDKSRARYFVFTAKHHDGIALFNTSVTGRSTSRLLFPNRDFVNELMQVSESKFPHLKRGLYFSLPEWYHPSYNDESLAWHGPPTDPYTKQRIVYTGSETVENFVNELQVPQLQELIHQHNPDILWCDIGGINNSTVWQSEYFNKALKEGRQVSVNDRCGDGSASDFTTIEYKAVKDTPNRFWEATRGMDPYSFGFNRNTKPEEYASTRELLENLVDSVCRGGNFLLNIGPDAFGKVPDPMAERLLEIGKWLELVEDSIFSSVPYWIASEEESMRFTASESGGSVYIFLFGEIKPTLQIKTPLPMKDSTKIRLMNTEDTRISWKMTQGILTLELEPLLSNSMRNILVPVFEIEF